MASKVWGYVRISKAVGQVEDRQVDLLMQEYGIPESDIFIDKMSGARLDRSALAELQRIVREGDVIVVESLSRISRSSKDLLALLSDWEQRGITFISHKEKLDFSSTTGKLMLTLLAALSEFERETLRDRVREGLASARARGRIGGRPKTDKKALEKAVKLYEAKAHSISEIVSLTTVSKSVLYRELKRLQQQELVEEA
ncbi:MULTISPECIES: recombinase family protein [unclassified Paenibacillus]|uniref:recombinase family protein n=1 Tax=unclassified Paenibacillus TaxID=185978 RepID=UPI001C117CE4|nr:MULTISPECIES: recombinase family protein [unclassified Paenibacillus]MBU5442453.1 recombinase family protein [Paenibacillus sp. MSJ-34]CAH0120788.1 DNA-invertase hin [Paenibacillus sp. CECT 9249]